MRHRKIAATLAALVCAGTLCACASADGRFATLTTDATRTLRLVVDSGLGSSVRVQAGIFADKVKLLTGGTLNISVEMGAPTARTVSDGGAELSLLGNPELTAADAAFSTFSMPFLYDNPEHMSAALNSEHMLVMLGEMLEPQGITPLAAFYNGSLFFMATGTELSSASDFDDRTIAVRGESSDGKAVLSALGANVAEPPAGMGVPVLGAELTLPDGSAVTTQAVETTAGRAQALLPDGDEQIYFSESYHQLSPVWMIGNAKTLSSLTASERAAISEALASLLPQIETRAIARESDAIRLLQESGAVIVGIDRQQIAAVVYDAAQGGYQTPLDFDERIYELVSTFSQ